ncbi:MAG: M24 family metallopeptidase, partial [Bacteroidales bacterium]
MIKIKSKREIELMREAGRIVALCHSEIAKIIKPGVTTRELDTLVFNIIQENGATPSFKGYGGFPDSICASPNNLVVNWFANDLPLKDGDIISVDIGACYKGYHGDSAWTYPVGTINEEKQHLLRETEASLWAGLNVVKAGI